MKLHHKSLTVARYALFVLALGVFTAPLAAQSAVSNVAAVQRADSTIVDITYNLAIANDEEATVTVRASRDGGSTFEDFPATSLSGAVGAGQSAGSAKSIVWDAGAVGWGAVLYASAQVELTATVNGEGGTGTAPVGFALIPAGSYSRGDHLNDTGMESSRPALGVGWCSYRWHACQLLGQQRPQRDDCCG